VSTASEEPSLAEHVCLQLVDQGAGHGWAIGSLLAPQGEIGRVWSLTRPLTYRAIDGLVAKGLVSRGAPESGSGSGRDRVVLAATAAGRRVARRWLDGSIEHLRDVRTELLVKLTLRDRAGLDREPLLRAQQAHFLPMIDALSAGAAPGDDLVGLWRRESARAVRRFLDAALDPDRVPRLAPGHPDLRLSARNQLHAVVTGVTHGDLMSKINVGLPDGQRLTAVITRDAAEDLDLAVGDDVIVIAKSTEVMVAKPA